MQIESLQNLISLIEKLYRTATEHWSIQHQGCNLKKVCVYKIASSPELQNEIEAYVQFLEQSLLELQGTLDELSTQSHFVIRSRVKTRNSIESKIATYCQSAGHQYGQVPINKCLNDLFGIRVICNLGIAYEQLLPLLNTGSVKCVDASKNDYRAVHVYFRQNNFVFPWELQIWDLCDEQSNICSHKYYKQGYTLWEQENREEG